MQRRVVVTGIGPVTGIGIGKDNFFENIIKHKTVIHEIPPEFEKNYAFKSRYFVPAPSFNLKDFNIPQLLEGAMERIAKFSVAGAKLAIEDAGFKIEPREKYFCTDTPGECHVLIGVGMSSLQTAFQSYTSHVFGEDTELLERYEVNGRFNRMVIPMLMPNSAAAWISILFGIKGTNYTINASCASGTYAIGEAYRRIASGCCDTAITGGVECLQEKFGAVMRGFDVLATLTKSEDGNPMPFSKKRSGFLFNEGAGCILVLEELNSARKRGARIYAEICGYESNSDAFNIIQMDNSGEQIVSLLRKVIGDKRIDYINAHGTATLANDEIEASTVQKVFGNRASQPLINSTKGILGHSIGASGAIEAAVTALSIYNSKVHGNLIEDPMENLNIITEARDVEIDYAISASYGFGGHNAMILMKRYEESNG